MKRKVDGMLLATFLTTIFYSVTYPFIHKEIMQVASENLIAINQIINCVSIVFFGWMWNKTSKLFEYYHVLCVAETLLGVISTSIATLTGNIIAYYIVDTLIFSIVTRNIICGGVKLKAMRYNTEGSRERYDNNNNTANAIGTIIGSSIAMMLELDFIPMLWLATLGNAIDNAFYIAIYSRQTKKLSPKINFKKGDKTT